ncbi:MAG: hypothetical protein RMK29_09730 [Myxococcales bacterium]|nr:hypothetical protein [Myxococcota bacterium]MDW8281981.1 hypothetical protein [Myxococcales bacterium]
MRNLILILCLASLSCNNPAPADTDMAMSMPDLSSSSGDMVIQSCCGRPGDTGNSLGVGKYCQGIADCQNNMRATICSSLGNTAMRKTFFCTFLCDPRLDMGNPCGEGAQCECDSGGAGCACTPTACVTNPPPGCMR